MKSVRSYLLAMASLLVLLIGIATVFIVGRVDAYGRMQNERQLLDTTRALSTAVDGRLRAYETLLQALRSSDATERRDWRAVDRHARKLLSGTDAWIVVGNRAGEQLVNTRLPVGAPLPKAPPPPIWDVLDTGRTHYCDLAQGVLERRILCVDVPIMEGGRAEHHLSVIFRPEVLDETLTGGVLGDGRLGAVIDRKGVIAWRSTALDRFLGAPATPDMRAMVRRQPEGVLSSSSLEGEPTVGAFSRSPISGWTFVVGVPQQQLAAPRRNAILLSMAAAAGFLLVGAILAYVLGRRLTRAIAHLGTAAQRIRASEAPSYQPSGLEEIDEVGRLLQAAVEQRDASQESFRLAQEVGGIGAWEWDLIADRGVVSDAYREMHGLEDSSGPLRMEQVFAAIHPDDLPAYRSRLSAALKRVEPSTNEYRVIRKDGAVRWLYAKGRPVRGPSGDVERALGVVLDLTERRLQEERLKLLMREVDHRANNLMAVVQGAVSLSRADDPNALKVVILGRVQALARAHQLLAESRWAGADLRRLVDDELRPFNDAEIRRVRIDGESVSLSPSTAQSVAMAIHELTTNAVKYGALSLPEGVVSIAWFKRDALVELTWSESGGPAVGFPTRKGFGTTVLQRSLLGVSGSVELEWKPEGLRCKLTFPDGDLSREEALVA